MEQLRARWAVVAVVTAVAAIGIMVAEPDYTNLQLADSAAEFARLLDHPGPAMLATAFDLLFAVAYGVLGIIGLRAHGRGTALARWATVAIVVGAASDFLENLLVMANIVQRDTLTDGWIDAMQVPGTTKWIATPGFLVLFGYIVRSALERRRPATD